MQPIPSSGDFDPWRDSYAQWLMAALSIVATGVSAWAVKLIGETLRETRRATTAALNSNKLMDEAMKAERAKAEDELRAYVYIKSIDLLARGSRDNFHFLLKVRFCNSGQTPADITGYALEIETKTSSHSKSGHFSHAIFELGPSGEYEAILERRVPYAPDNDIAVASIWVRYRYNDRFTQDRGRDFKFAGFEYFRNIAASQWNIVPLKQYGEVARDDEWRKPRD